MHKNRIFLTGLVLVLSSVTFPACENAHSDIDITLQSDYSQIVEAINGVDQSLTAKLGLIETAVAEGFADVVAAQQLVQQAVASLSGTLDEKLAAVETAVKSGTSSLEIKLGLIEAAMASGFADGVAQQALIQEAIEALSGTTAERLAQIAGAVKHQAGSLETKLALIETALKGGLADENAEQKLLLEALATLEGTLSERLEAVGSAMGSQTASLAAKLDLVDAALENGLAETADALALLRQAVEALNGTAAEKLAALDTAIRRQTSALETKLGLIEAAVKNGFADDKAQKELLQQAVKTLGGTAETKLAAISNAIGSQSATLSSKLGLIETAVAEGFAADLVQQLLIRQAIQSMGGTLSDKLSAIDTALLQQTDSLTTKLGLIVAELDCGLADEATALGQLGTAVTALAGTLDNPQAARSVVSAIDSIDTRLSTDGAIGKALSGLLSTIQGMNCTEALKKMEQAIDDLSSYLKYTDHEFVEMGDGLKWATRNVNAKNPWEKGDYFAFGETSKKVLYSPDTYKFHEKLGSGFYRQTRYWWKGEAFATYGYVDDAARQNWGGRWRVPSRAEWEWLIAHCTWTWTDSTGTQGLLVTSKEPGYESSQLFLPAGGYYEVNLDGTSLLSCRDTAGFYWTSEIVEDWGDPGRFHIEKGSGLGHPKVIIDTTALIWSGLLVRPVAN